MIVNPFKHGYIMHGSPNGSYPLGRPEHWDMWIKELKALGADGVKVLLFDNATDIDKEPIRAIRRLLDNGLVVVARLYRDKPNPGVLSGQQLIVAKLLIGLGVRFLEVNNEPNLHVEWQNGIPSNAPEVIAATWLTDAPKVIDLGGYPAFPACAPGGNWDDMDMMGKVFDAVKPYMTSFLLNNSWVSVHNYSGNHPLDYPYDAINVAEKGTANILAPGESNGFRKYEGMGELYKKHFGSYPVIISTEGGPVIDPGFSGDTRYPKVDNEDIHAAVSVETARIMMSGTVPDYFYATCFWVMANRMMENPVSAGFESHAWYPHWKEHGIKAVQALKDLPKKERPRNPIIPPAPVNLEKAIRDAVKKDLNWDAFPWLTKYASENNFYKGLLTEKETKVTVSGITYLARAFGNVIIYCPEGHYSKEETLTIALFEE